MNENLRNDERIQFKNWIKKRFISSIDFKSTSSEDILLWAEALQELSKELIDTVQKFDSSHHEIVPFCRRKG